MLAEGEFESICLYDDDQCELDDETPLQLVLAANATKHIECRLRGWMPPSPALIYTNKSNFAMSNIIKALNDAVDGCLRLSEANIGMDKGLVSALRCFTPHSITTLHLDGNILSNEFIEAVVEIAPHLPDLSLQYCQLNSKTIRLLVQSDRKYPQLRCLNLSYNDLYSTSSTTTTPTDSIGALIDQCSNLQTLSLSCCNLNGDTTNIAQLIEAISKCKHLEKLDLSENSSILSEHCTQVLSSCEQLKMLNAAATGVNELHAEMDKSSTLMDINLSLCELNVDSDELFNWLLKCCNELTVIDLRATNITHTQLAAICKEKANKLPIITLKLAGCMEIECDSQTFISMLNIEITADFAIRFALSDEYRQKILDSLPDSYAFCIV